MPRWVDRHKAVVREEFTRQADRIVSAEALTDERILARIAEAVAATPQERVLDVACGTGIVAFRLAQEAKEVVGLDLTGEMLQQARRLRHERGVPNLRFELGEAEALPFEDGSFDVVVCRLAIHHFEEPAVALREMVRVTRSGGRVVIADIVSSEDPQEAELHNALEMLRDPSHVRMLPRSELLALLHSQGLGLEVRSTVGWRKERQFDEWIAITNTPERYAPLHAVMAALARANVRAGINLRLQGEALRFEQSWLLAVAVKRSS